MPIPCFFILQQYRPFFRQTVLKGRGGTIVPDAELVKQAQAGIEEAMIELLKKMESPLYRTAYYMLGNEQDALDITQEALIKIYQHIGQFKQEAQFKTWAQRIVTNLCIDFCRRKKQLAVSSRPQEIINQLHDHHVEREFDRRILQEEVQMAIRQLREEQRAAIVLRYMHDFSYQEIAEALALPLNTVKSHLFRARQTLKELLSSGEKGAKGGDVG